ncbi:hypothetical protein A3715_07415 [Oleiphilus sp. HI0009]|uniref:MGMT family protein n=1 Tax=unclassified Oleiphilus TaxID=2631174 RepID=UPI0007C3D985|nr:MULTISPECIES: MGMT family protein [unclassified Oleiphilus]KZX81352.1 hypothetical protein A3715_07415 [Oleiphilus sp. HI0009]KZY63279.1 hypothetical protein A3738_12155 [Oleiphilus sp. HI0066]KZY70808.1 hypothetical protein A3739_06040 [Oleiphilus sp. HI0067]
MDLSSLKPQAILTTVNSIPEGRLSSYGKIAAAAGLPQNARLVGQVLKHLPKDSQIPWHRVLNAQGNISFPKDSPSYQRQQAALMNEGHPKTLSKSHFLQNIWPS